MSQNPLLEEPLVFDDPEEINESKLSIEQFKETESQKRKSKTLDFCLGGAKWIAPIAFLLIIGDLIFQHMELETTLLKDCFSLLTYVVTAALGFVFANNTK